MIPFVQTAEQLIVVRLLTGVGLGFAITAPFPVAAELMPAQHRRTYGAIYEICWPSAFALLPLVAGLSWSAARTASAGRPCRAGSPCLSCRCWCIW